MEEVVAGKENEEQRFFFQNAFHTLMLGVLHTSCHVNNESNRTQFKYRSGVQQVQQYKPYFRLD